jgi:hypothetical protein
MEHPLDRVIAAIAQGTNLRIHEIDIENLVGNGILNVESVRSVRNKYESAIHLSSRDIVVVAAGPQNKRAVYEGWGNAIYQWRKGKDGADNAMLDFFQGFKNIDVFSHIFIASGDGGLAPIAKEATSHGIDTTIVTMTGQKSWKLNAYESINLANVKEIK